MRECAGWQIECCRSRLARRERELGELSQLPLRFVRRGCRIADIELHNLPSGSVTDIRQVDR